MSFSLESLRKKCYITREGVSFLGLSEAADSLGFRTIGVKIPFEMLNENVPLPCIVYWRQKHFIVVYKIRKDKIGLLILQSDLLNTAMRNLSETGHPQLPMENLPVLFLLLNLHLLFLKMRMNRKQLHGFRFLFKYFRLYRKYFYQLVLGLILGSCIQLVIPFLTQSIVDIGLNNNDIGFIYLILFAQLALVFGRMSVEFIRGWLLLHIGSRVNVAIISGFLQKLMSLPVAFFDTKLTGDILQRIEDNNRIEEFLTSASL